MAEAGAAVPNDRQFTPAQIHSWRWNDFLEDVPSSSSISLLEMLLVAAERRLAEESVPRRPMASVTDPASIICPRAPIALGLWIDLPLLQGGFFGSVYGDGLDILLDKLSHDARTQARGTIRHLLAIFHHHFNSTTSATVLAVAIGRVPLHGAHAHARTGIQHARIFWLTRHSCSGRNSGVFPLVNIRVVLVLLLLQLLFGH